MYGHHHAIPHSTPPPAPRRRRGSAAGQVRGPGPRSAARALPHATGGLGDLVAGALQALAGLDDAGRHRRLGRLAIGPRVVLLFVADVAVDLEHAVEVAEHVLGDRPGEGVLRVGVDVHLDHAVRQGLADLIARRAGPAVEDQVERALLAVLGANRVLDLLEHGGPQLDVPWLVDAVHVAERRGEDVAALFAEPDGLGGGQRVPGGGVELLVDLTDDAVLLAADDADLHLHDHAGLGALIDQLGGDREVLVERYGGSVPHV